MLIETTTAFDNKNDAEDNLQGIKTLPGFLFGYVRQPNESSRTYDIVHVFNSNDAKTHHLLKQRVIEEYEFNEEAMYFLEKAVNGW
jgi:hypothetical protein